MLCDYENRRKEGQKTVHSKRQRFITKVREEQLQKIFKSLRTTIFKSNFQDNVAPQVQMPLQPFVVNLTPENIHLVQQYLMRLIPPQIPMHQPMITDQIHNYPLEQNNRRQNNPPKHYEIYFEKQNFRVYKKLLGQGSFSKVWLGMDLNRNQRIAAKEVKELEESQQRCLKQFNCPNIIKVFKIIRHQNSTFIILQFCAKNLREQLIECNYDLAKSLDYFDQIVKGMNQLQKNNIIHRDLKFQNILLSHNVIKIADFGLAKFLGDEMEIQSRRCGSPYTMAPQIYFAESHYPSYTSKCDIWSLGVILHQMLYKSHPFGKSKQQFRRGKRTSHKKRFGALDHLIDRCLKQNPRDRADWRQFMSIYQKYFHSRERYLQASILPIDCQSILFEQKPVNKVSVIVDSLAKKDKQVQIVFEVEMRKSKSQESMSKMINDKNAHDCGQQKKVEKPQNRNENRVEGSKKIKKNSKEIKSNLKQQSQKVPRIQTKKQKTLSSKIQGQSQYMQLQLKETEKISIGQQKQQNSKQNRQNKPQKQQNNLKCELEPRASDLKLIKLRSEANPAKKYYQLAFFGLIAVILLLTFLLE